MPSPLPTGRQLCRASLAREEVGQRFIGVGTPGRHEQPDLPVHAPHQEGVLLAHQGTQAAMVPCRPLQMDRAAWQGQRACGERGMVSFHPQQDAPAFQHQGGTTQVRGCMRPTLARNHGELLQARAEGEPPADVQVKQVREALQAFEGRGVHGPLRRGDSGQGEFLVAALSHPGVTGRAGECARASTSSLICWRTRTWARDRPATRQMAVLPGVGARARVPGHAAARRPRWPARA